MKKLLIASNNAGKLREFRTLFSPYFDRILSPRELGIVLDPEETGSTFEENARIKCEAFRAACPDCAVLADDSGLAVDALGGAPGVYSARYAGIHGDDQANIDKLLADLGARTDRAARFVSALALITEEGRVLCAHGEVEGQILFARDGTGGFGYDPVFYCDELGKSFGACAEEEKNAVSHRSRAARVLADKLCASDGKRPD